MFTEVIAQSNQSVYHPRHCCPIIYKKNVGIHTLYPVDGLIKWGKPQQICYLCLMNVYEIHWTNFLVDLILLPSFRYCTWQEIIKLHMEILSTVTPGLVINRVEITPIRFNVTLSLDDQTFHTHIKFSSIIHPQLWMSNIVDEIISVSTFCIITEKHSNDFHYRDRCTAFIDRHLQCSGLCQRKINSSNNCLVCYLFLSENAEEDTSEWDILQQKLSKTGSRPIVVVALRGFLHVLLNTVKVADFPPNFQYRFVSNAEMGSKRFRKVVMEEIKQNYNAK